MLEINILEGCRGTGKSTIAFKLRQKMSDTTLINFTGFNEEGEKGLQKVSEYYDLWMKFLFSIATHESKFVFDRFYFSERVFSILYKDYDFKSQYTKLLDDLESLSEMGVKINIFYLGISDEDALQQRLIRDKVPFGKAEESVIESMKQQTLYSTIFTSLFYNRTNENLKIYFIDTTDKTTDDVYDEITKLKTT